MGAHVKFMLSHIFQKGDEKVIQLHQFPNIDMKTGSAFSTWVVIWLGVDYQIVFLWDYFRQGLAYIRACVSSCVQK